MAHAVEHAPRLRRVLDLHDLADAVQAERAQRVELALIGAVLGLVLGDRHADSPSGAAGASGVAAASSTPAAASVLTTASATVSLRPVSTLAIVSEATSSAPPMPSTWLIDRPRSSATS